MKLADVASRMFRSRPEVVRAEMRASVGHELQSLIARVGGSPTEIAEAIGVQRAHLYKVFDGAKPLLALDLWLLPHAVLRPIVDDLASVLGMELRPATAVPDVAPREHVARCVGELTSVIAQAVSAQADEYESADEARAELAAWDRVDRLSAERRAHLEQVIAQGGARVVPLRKGGA